MDIHKVGKEAVDQQNFLAWSSWIFGLVTLGSMLALVILFILEAVQAL